MSRYHSYINTALRIIKSYKGDTPFSIFIKQCFSKEKKFGSRDRKQIAALCYSYFRVGLGFNKQLNENNLLSAFFLANTGTSSLVQELKPAWVPLMNSTIDEKINTINQPFNLANIFPFKEELNNTIDADSFCRSLLIQPELYTRIRPQYKKEVVEKINTTGIQHRFLNHATIQFPPGTNIENFLEPDKEVVIQDLNSQKVLDYICKHRDIFPDDKIISAWDCCAASGGKSILLHDLLPQKIKLTVSDIRQSIISNLHDRFKRAGIKGYEHFVADISNNEKKSPAGLYDIIICDAPCTGSGTWSRTPEQLFFFEPSTINEYASLQKKIATNALSHLNNDGLFFYITCSVFKKENEDVVQHIKQQPGMQLLEMKHLYGYEMKADSMFVAVFKKTGASLKNKASEI